jgi:hypothetical protein
MSQDLGWQLIELQLGDSVVATVDEEEYVGEVVKTNREKCDLVAGFIEDGYISVYLQVRPETADKYDLSTQYLVIGSTETVPNDFELPTASVYDMSEEELITKLGEVSEIAVE